MRNLNLRIWPIGLACHHPAWQNKTNWWRLVRGSLVRPGYVSPESQLLDVSQAPHLIRLRAPPMKASRVSSNKVSVVISHGHNLGRAHSMGSINCWWAGNYEISSFESAYYHLRLNILEMPPGLQTFQRWKGDICGIYFDFKSKETSNISNHLHFNGVTDWLLCQTPAQTCRISPKTVRFWISNF